MNNLIYQSVKVPHRSGHYLGHHFIYTAGIGEIIPVLCQPLIPNSRVSLKTLLSASLAPLASDCFLHASMRLEAFFVPMRFLYGGYEKWVTRDVVYPTTNMAYSSRLGVKFPRMKLTGAQFKTYCAPGTLSDYLGVRVDVIDLPYINDNDVVFLNIFPYLAYRYVWDTWYRRADVQVPFFRCPAGGTAVNTYITNNLPFIILHGSNANDYSAFDFNVATSLLSTIQRNFPIDYFTSALVSPQLGSEETVAVVPDSGDGHITISALRASNALQVWRERLGLSGPRLVDFVRSQYGADLSDGNGRRPMYLGSGSVEFYTKGVDQAFNDTSSSIIANNPFQSVGARYGQPLSNGELSLVDDFTADEPGYLMVMATAVPKVMYSSGIERYMLHYTKNGAETDLANPILQSVGNQEVKMAEISANAVVEPTSPPGTNPTINSVFGYQQRYLEYMQRNDRVSGLFREGESLQHFVSQRYIGTPSDGTPGASGTTINDAFLRIPKNYLDGVSAVGSNLSTYGVMCDMFFDFGVSQPLYDSSIPSLVNPAEEHGKDIMVMRGGKRII